MNERNVEQPQAGRDPARMPRSREDLRAQFEFERQQRTRLLQSTREERQTITSQIYDELFERFPEHSALTETAAGRAEFGRRRAGLIRWRVPATRCSRSAAGAAMR